MGGSWSKLKRAFSSNRDNDQRFHGVDVDGDIAHTLDVTSNPPRASPYVLPPRLPSRPTPISSQGVLPEPGRSNTARGGEVRLMPNAPPSDSLLRTSTDPRPAPGVGESVPQDEMLLQLSCPICLDLYTDPIILPCLHSLCWECANSLWEMMNPFLCPECKKEIGRENLKRNFPLSTLVSIYRRDLETRAESGKTNEATPIVSDMKLSSGTLKNTFVQPKTCATCTQEPRVFCLTCTMAFCDTCLVYYHPTVESTPDHPLLPVKPKVKTESETQSNTVLQSSLVDVSGTLRRVNAELIRNFVGVDRLRTVNVIPPSDPDESTM